MLSSEYAVFNYTESEIKRVRDYNIVHKLGSFILTVFLIVYGHSKCLYNFSKIIIKMRL